MEVPRSALQFSVMSDDALSLPSPLGQDTETILKDLLEYDEETIEKLKSDGVLN